MPIDLSHNFKYNKMDTNTTGSVAYYVAKFLISAFPKGTSIFTAESYTINLVLSVISESNNKNIFLDTLSV